MSREEQTLALAREINGMLAAHGARAAVIGAVAVADDIELRLGAAGVELDPRRLRSFHGGFRGHGHRVARRIVAGAQLGEARARLCLLAAVIGSASNTRRVNRRTSLVRSASDAQQLPSVTAIYRRIKHELGQAPEMHRLAGFR